MNIIVEPKNKKTKKLKKKIAIVKNNIAIRIAGKVSRYIDASMNRATPSRDHPRRSRCSGEVRQDVEEAERASGGRSELPQTVDRRSERVQ